MSCEDLTSNEQLKLYFFTFFLGACCLTANVELSCRGLNADTLCMVKIYVKANTFGSRSVAPVCSSGWVRPARA
jgi:hypothetical protein